METKRENRGGARAGAGRKAKELKGVRFDLDAEKFKLIDEIRGECPRNTWIKQAIDMRLRKELEAQK